MRKIGNVISIDKNPKLVLTDQGNIKSTSPANVVMCLKADEQLGQYLRRNDFSQEYELTQEIRLGNTTFQAGELPASFVSVLTVYFENNLGVVYSPNAMKAGLETFFSERSYNPVKEYMERVAMKWDGRKRIRKMFQHYLGAEDTELISKIAEMWLVGAVAKVYEPFVKFDYVLDLVGGQGVGKTSLLQKIGGPWYTDAVTDFNNKDNFDIMLKSLIVNDDEMVASNRMSFAETKAFISKTSLRYRRPYMSKTEEFAKNFILARTTNQVEYLKDKTGERRFLSVMVDGARQKKHPMEIEQATIDQIWGEAVSIYKEGFELKFDSETEAKLETYREKFMYRDEVEIQVMDYLEMPIPSHWEKMTVQKQHQYTASWFDNSSEVEFGTEEIKRVSTREIMYNLFMKGSNDRKLSAKINLIIGHFPNWEKKTYRVGKKIVKGFVRIE